MFTSERLRFRAFQQTDRDHILNLYNDPQVSPYITHGFVVPVNAEKIEHIWKMISDAVMFCMVEELETGSVVGFSVFLPVNEHKNRNVNWGIALSSSHWHKGYGEEIGKFMVDYAFRHLQKHRVSLTVRDVQERELSLIREFETKLLARQEEFVAQDLSTHTAVSESLARISHLLRQFLRSLGGEDVHSPTTQTDDEEGPETLYTPEHALSRETELVRLEHENEELRRMLGLVVPVTLPHRGNSDQRPVFAPGHDEGINVQSLGIPTGATGPYGTYKRRPQV
ncbi:hypothetical protein H0H87_003458 [Tephrocybe sp. NHM501043]|nr:hypothetical protein H0H87_003458 [Tephrocybe sp. NHM501043]